jgi:hypothetical protein
MKVTRFAMQFTYPMVGVLVLMCVVPSRALAQSAHAHALSAADGTKASALINVVRESTERFKDVAVAEAEGYGSQFGCVTGDYSGAMGMHFVNFPLVFDGELDATKPEIVIYEPMPSGQLRLIGADYLVRAAAWDAKNAGPPHIMGQLMLLFESPNRFGLPAFYTLHVWAWKKNPTGAFVNWHSNVSCDAFSGQQH